MLTLKQGDRVDCHVKLNAVISPYEDDFDESLTFEIIGLDEHGYYLYIPNYIVIKGTVELDDYSCVFLKISKKFIGEHILFIRENMISRVRQVFDGCFCVKCGEFHAMASPNQENGTLICWSCRRSIKTY